MHPITFVSARIAAGEASEVIDLLHRFLDKLRAMRTPENSQVYTFAIGFLTCVCGQLHNVDRNQAVDDGKVLAVWASLGFFGIDRDELPDSL